MVDIVLEGKGRNALGTRLLGNILAQLQAAGGEPLLVRGADGTGAFSAGLDLREVTSLSPGQMGEFIRLLENVFTTLYLHPAPTVALVNGHAIAGGCVLALCCDHRIAPPDASLKIGLNETAIGVVFPPRTLAIVRSRLPPRYQDELLLGGGLYAPEPAKSRGLIDEIAENALDAAQKKLAALAANPRAAYTMVKRDLRGDGPQALASDARVERYIAEAVPIWTGPDLKTRVAALLGKS
jgi:enoyl-CoA hydratase/carnithine racemase